MAILKHIAGKNANYAEIQCYIMFEHDEDTNKPILDENGELIHSLENRKAPTFLNHSGRGKQPQGSI